MDALVAAARELAERPGGSPVKLLAPPFCYGAWRGPRVDLPILASRVRAKQAAGAWAVVLSDIPDDDESLMSALQTRGVLGALALGCGELDIWVEDSTAGLAALQDLRVRRTTDSPLPRIVVRDVDELRSLWAIFEGLAGPNPPS
ncbi:MAG: hypothetical protein KDA24_03755 [Deltaproteobacteria bacterium]|nr:hypothetical protein [Deltaproteobacteria bacterium]